MDLRQLEHVTRRALEAEATRRGVRDPQLRTRAELIRLIVQHAATAPFLVGRKRLSEGKQALEQARDALELAAHLVADLAGDALPAGLRERALARRKPATVDVDNGRPQASAEPQAVAPAPSNVAPAPEVEGQHDAPAVVADRVSSSAQEPDGTAAPEQLEPEWSLASVRPVHARSLSPNAPAPQRFDAEPIRTLSMARLLAAQGERIRALSIYEELIARNSEDPTPRHEAEILRKGGELSGLPVPAATPAAKAAPDSKMAHLRWERSKDEHVTVHFEVSEAGISRAEALLGRSGALTLRLVTIRPDRERIVASEIEDHALPERAGAFEIGPLDVQARCLLSLGLRAGERFVSIAHGSPLT